MRSKSKPVSVKVTIPVLLGHLTCGVSEIDVPGNTVGDVLNNVVERLPRLRVILFPSEGHLDEFTYIALNQRVLTPPDNPLAEKVASGDEVSIIIPLAGG